MNGMKNVICNAFAFKEAYQTSMQLGGRVDESMLAIYMKNIFVSLKSAKLNNPSDDVLLLTNCALPPEYERLFARHQIQVRVIAFDSFVMPREFVWSLAYFKLCALKYVAERTEYDRCLLIDADTVTVRSLEELWEESDSGLLLFPVGHSFRHKDRQLLTDAYKRLYPGENLNIVHYGGEFVCAGRECLGRFVKLCEEVYNTVRDSGFAVSEYAGDELVLSVAAARMPGVIGAGAYVYRYWTEEFYLVSTNTVSNPVAVWHVPAEKRDGFVYLYRYYEKHGAFPCADKIAAVMGIVKAKRPFNYYTLRRKLCGRLRSLKQARAREKEE